MRTKRRFQSTWIVDFEFTPKAGCRPVPVCYVAYELASGRTVRAWVEGSSLPPGPLYELHDETLFVAYSANAELGCHLVLGWELPCHVLCLFTEYRAYTNGRTSPKATKLLDALRWFKLPTLDAEHKASMQNLAARGKPFTCSERRDLLTYCEGDVRSTTALFYALRPHLVLTQALERGRYQKAVARMEHAGIPVDVERFTQLQTAWPSVRQAVIDGVDTQYHVFDGPAFREHKFLAWVNARRIPWPTFPSGKPVKTKVAFAAMAELYPEVAPLGELRSTLSKLRKQSLTVGPDGRCRTDLLPFGTLTGRHSPGASSFIFSLPRWIRTLMQPEAGYALVYQDWEAQEYGAIAALSDDRTMQAMYLAGDPYVALAKLFGAMPEDGTRDSHPIVRDAFKVIGLGTLYGMSQYGLAHRLRISLCEAEDLLDRHHTLFPTYWRWVTNVLDTAAVHRRIKTVYGWPFWITGEVSQNTLLNFSAQAHGGELLRQACVLLTEHGFEVNAPIHDAVLCHVPLEGLEETKATLQNYMALASEKVLGGFPLRSEPHVTCYPDHYRESGGEYMHDLVWRHIEALAESQQYVTV